MQRRVPGRGEGCTQHTLMDQLIYFAELLEVHAEARRRIKEWSDKLDLGEYLYPQNPSRGFAFGRGRRHGDREAALKEGRAAVKGQPAEDTIYGGPGYPTRAHQPTTHVGLDPVNTDLFKSVINEQIERGNT